MALGLVPEPAPFAHPDDAMYFADISAAFANDGSCLRMITLGESIPEEMVYVDCFGNAEGMPSKVVRLVATENILTGMSSSRRVSDSPMATRKFQAEIPPKDAMLFFHLWKAVLLRVKPRGLTVMAESYSEVHFAVCSITIGCIGVMTAYAPKGSVGARLTEIGSLLSSLATNPDPSAQKSLLDRARQAAIKLTEDIGVSAPRN